MEKIWNVLAITTCATLLILFTIFCISPKHTIRYELDNESGRAAIVRDIENAFDERILLTREITWQEAISMCDSLNQQLKKYPIK